MVELRNIQCSWNPTTGQASTKDGRGHYAILDKVKVDDGGIGATNEERDPSRLRA